MTASAWGRSASPISVRRTGRGPPGRLNNDVLDQPLERRHLLADAGLGVAELPGGGAERSGRDDRPERKEVAQLDALPPRFHQ